MQVRAWLRYVIIQISPNLTACFLRSQHNSTLRGETQQEHHYEQLATAAVLDPVNALGADKLQTLVERFSKRTVAIELTSRACRLCGEETDTFSLLACGRQCDQCFYRHPAATMCSLDYAEVSLKSA
jgi:hypothetical protein